MEQLKAQLNRVVEEQRKIAPMAFAVRLPIRDTGLTWGELGFMWVMLPKDEHRIERIEDDTVQLILV